MTHKWSYAVFGLLFGYFLFVLASETQDSGNFWDFKIYYSAASEEIENPYDARVLQSEHHDDSKLLSYKYLPLTRYLFKVFRVFEYETALNIYIGLMILVLIAFVYLMNQQLSRGDPLLMLVLLLAFNSCFYLAFRSGNIMPLLSLLILFALHALLKDKLLQFVILVVITACFKVFPILLLGLLWFKQAHSSSKLMIGGLLLFLSFVGLNMIFWQDFMLFLEAVQETTSEFGIINPNAWSFSSELSHFIVSHKLGLKDAEWVAYILYFSIVIPVIWKTIQLIRARMLVPLDWNVLSICLIGLAIILPRFKDYDYILLIPAAYVIIKQLNLRQVLVLISAWFLCSGIIVDIPIVGYLLELSHSYQSWLMACILWYFSLKMAPKSSP